MAYVGKMLYCHFCGKNQHQVSHMIAGPEVFICNECTDLAYRICHNVEFGELEYQSWLPLTDT